jgi:pyridoxamine 5'-phosphate oxidase
MALATSTADGAPSVRMVLLKGADERGFVFFTGYVSRKAGELDANPRAALLFHWDPLGRQVRVEGRVERVAGQESDASQPRPREAQLAAAAPSRAPCSVARRSTHASKNSPASTRQAMCGGDRRAAIASCRGHEFRQHRDVACTSPALSR